MNITDGEISRLFIAKISGCKANNKRIIYSFVDQYYSLCLDKNDILESQLEACKNLLLKSRDNKYKQIIEKEICESSKYL